MSRILLEYGAVIFVVGFSTTPALHLYSKLLVHQHGTLLYTGRNPAAFPSAAYRYYRTSSLSVVIRFESKSFALRGDQHWSRRAEKKFGRKKGV